MGRPLAASTLVTCEGPPTSVSQLLYLPLLPLLLPPVLLLRLLLLLLPLLVMLLRPWCRSRLWLVLQHLHPLGISEGVPPLT